MTSVYVFPGQGSQSIGMGLELFKKFPEFTAKADAILGYSIEELCINNIDAQLNQTQYTQPALYVVNALTYFDKIQQHTIKPDYVAGHSLGEYNALLAAEVFDFETGLQLVQKRGALMSQAQNGKMAAVIGLTKDRIQEILKHHNLNNVAIANLNTHTQIVISGKHEEIETARTLLLNHYKDTHVIPLAVSGAFHSPFMHEAQTHFANFLRKFTFNPPTIPVIANISARPYEHHEIHKNLAEQIASPVRWVETVEYLLSQGEVEFQEIGPGRVLTGLVNRIKKGV